MSTNYEKGFNNLPDLKNHPAGDYMGGDWPTKFNIIFDDFTCWNPTSSGWRVGTQGGSTVALVPTSQFDSRTANGVLRLTTSSSAASAAGSCLLAWDGGSGSNKATMPWTTNEPFFWQVRYKFPSNATDAAFGINMSETTLLSGTQYTGLGFIHKGFQVQFNPNSGSPAASFLHQNAAIVGAFGHLDGKDEGTVLDRWNVLTFYWDPKRQFMVYQINDKRYDAVGTERTFLDGQDMMTETTPSSKPTGSIMMPTIGLVGAVSQSIDIDYVMFGYGRPEEQF